MTKKTTEAASGRFDYDALNIGAQSKEALEATAAGILALGRRSTEQAFELGDLLEHASELVEPGTFEKWVSQRCDISSKTARNYRSLARNLARYRTRAVELAVSPTVLFHLASAPDEKVEAALAFAEENDGIRVSEVKALLADGSEAASKDVTAKELDREAWPEAKELELWLSQSVLPLLDWATSRTKQPEWPLQAAVASNSPDKVMRSGLEALGGVVRVDAPSLDPSEDEDEALEDYVPPAMFTRSGGASGAIGSNVLSFGSTEGLPGLRKPKALTRKAAEASAD
ncbi:hypothetical protein [Agrobacterium tumefaciens]|nr:hypothetical protein [Agrobacterium tumefaciens]